MKQRIRPLPFSACCYSALILFATAPGSLNLYAETPLHLDDITVTAPGIEAGEAFLNAADLHHSGAINAAEAAANIPGVSSVRRGANAAEPVIRGLGWERVTTQAGCHPMYGACPSRMDPPATYLSPAALSGLRVIKGIPPVTLGPGATGGKLIVDTDYDRGTDPQPGWNHRLTLGWNEAREGWTADAVAEGGTANLDVRATAGAADLSDYTSADGTRVPAGLNEQTVALSLGARLTPTSRLFGHINFKHENDVDYPSLPMDVEYSDATTVTLGYRINPDAERWERLEVNAGYTYVDHLMNNRRKSNRRMMEAEAPSTAETMSLKLDTGWRLSPELVLTIGADGERVERDATRTRRIAATGAVLRDPIWPEAERDLVGFFSEATWQGNHPFTLRIGARIDHAASDAGAVDLPITLSPGNRSTARREYVAIYGPEAGDVDRSETLFSGNLLAEWQPEGDWSAYLGAGRTERYPSVTELYYAFAPAHNGWLVGNPALDTEKKYEVNVGVVRKGTWIDIELSAFAAKVDDYILSTRLFSMDVNNDGVTDVVRGFRNVDAELAGGEAAAVARLAEGVTLPVSLAFVRGRNTTDGRDLPEIPPFNLEAALRYARPEGARPWWIQAGVRYDARQNKIDPLFPEDATPSWIVAHLRGGITIGKGLTLEVGIENLLDEEYQEHLTREAALATGELMPGDEIPAPGRHVTVRLTMAF